MYEPCTHTTIHSTNNYIIFIRRDCRYDSASNVRQKRTTHTIRAILLATVGIAIVEPTETLGRGIRNPPIPNQRRGHFMRYRQSVLGGGARCKTRFLKRCEKYIQTDFNFLFFPFRNRKQIFVEYYSSVHIIIHVERIVRFFLYISI